MVCVAPKSKSADGVVPGEPAPADHWSCMAHCLYVRRYACDANTCKVASLLNTYEMRPAEWLTFFLHIHFCNMDLVDMRLAALQDIRTQVSADPSAKYPMVEFGSGPELNT